MIFNLHKSKKTNKKGEGKYKQKNYEEKKSKYQEYDTISF